MSLTPSPTHSTVATVASLWLAGLPGSVEAACRVALQVEGHEGVAGLLEAGDHRHAVFEEPLHLLRLDLDPGYVAMVADPDLGEAEALHHRLRPLDLPERLDGHPGAVRDPGAQAGEGGLVPVREAQLPGREPDLGLAQPRLQEREADAPADGRAVAGPV